MPKQPAEDLTIPMLNWKLKNLIRLGWILALAMAWSHPAGLNLILMGNLAAMLSLYYLRFTRLPSAKNVKRLWLVKNTKEAFFSVHLPLTRFGEEKHLEQLKSLSELDYGNFQVLILDCGLGANTRKALKKFCRKKEKIFTYHKAPTDIEDNRKLLNTCLDLCHPDADYVLTIEQGLLPQRHLLSLANERLSVKRLDYLSFPQALSSKKSTLLKRESELFYQVYMRCLPLEYAPLLGGSVTVIRKSALKHIGGWQQEDHCVFGRTGVELLKHRFKGSYEHSEVGLEIANKTNRHLIPRARQQRANAQTLLNLSFNDIKAIGKSKTLPIFLQLSARLEFALIPALYFGAKALGQHLGHNLIPYAPGAGAFAGTTLIIALYLKLSLFYQKLGPLLGAKKILKVYFAHIGLALAFHVSWAKDILGINPDFRHSIIKNQVFAHFMLCILAGAISFALYKENQNLASLTPFLAVALCMAGALILEMDAHKERDFRGQNDLGDPAIVP